MKLRNVSNTIISLGERVLMPGDETTISAATAENPAIKAMVKHGDFAIDDTEERIAAAAEAARKEAEKKAAEDAAKKAAEDAAKKAGEDKAATDKTAKATKAAKTTDKK